MISNERDFDRWLAQFKPAIASYDYYVDFEKVVANAEVWKAELHLMNSLLGSKDIERDFLALVEKYPDVLNVIPELLAVRAQEIPIYEVGVLTRFQFGKRKPKNTPREYADFMRSTGLFGLMESHSITNLNDYVLGVEVGLDSNARKNRGGHLMENIVESFLIYAGLQRRESDRGAISSAQPNESGIYFKELCASRIQAFWGIDLSAVTNNGTVEKRFDFVVKTVDCVYGIEANFYAQGGSKLNETARSYKEMAKEASSVSGFTFVWVTDGGGWRSARNNLRETFEVMDAIFNLAELEDGAFKNLFF